MIRRAEVNDKLALAQGWRNASIELSTRLRGVGDHACGTTDMNPCKKEHRVQIMIAGQHARREHWLETTWCGSNMHT
jgi:hypothetical protein